MTDEHDVPTGRDTTHAIGSSVIRSERNGESNMSTEKNVQIVKDFFAAIGRGDREGVLALVAEDIEWIIPGEDWPPPSRYPHCRKRITPKNLPK